MELLIILLVYLGGWHACEDAGTGFWKGSVWPYWVTKRLVLRALNEEKEC